MAFSVGASTRRGSLYTLKAAGAETASTTHGSINVLDGSGSAVVTVAVTAASGTSPTMTVVVEGSDDGTTWFEIGTIGANGYRAGTTGTAPSNFTGAATTRAVLPAPQFVRTRSVVGGTTPSFTYSVVVQG
jgi:VCBS repeat-containing protein